MGGSWEAGQAKEILWAESWELVTPQCGGTGSIFVQLENVECAQGKGRK